MKNFVDFFRLNGEILYWIFLGPLKGHPIKFSPIFHQLVIIGVQAWPMAALTSLSVGLTLAMQGAHELARFGATTFVPDLIAMSLLRELGPLIVAVVVIGRSGSAVTAEIGTMKVSEEIEALEVMAINPVRYLVVPRFIAMLIMLPVLTIFGSCIGMAGGWIICFGSLDMSTLNYVLRLIDTSQVIDLYSGLFKSFIFAWLIIVIACQTGLRVSGGAEGVGRATTSSVVASLLAVLIANAVLTGVFFIL